MSYLFIGLALAALGGLAAIRSRLATIGETKRLVSLYIVGYAMAEGVALFAGVIWYLGGSRDWFIAGLVLVVAAFQILPVKRPDY
jgi:hypothetical protein